MNREDFQVRLHFTIGNKFCIAKSACHLQKFYDILEAQENNKIVRLFHQAMHFSRETPDIYRKKGNDGGKLPS